jgi:hypothetical protein
MGFTVLEPGAGFTKTILFNWLMRRATKTLHIYGKHFAACNSIAAETSSPICWPGTTPANRYANLNCIFGGKYMQLRV